MDAPHLRAGRGPEQIEAGARHAAAPLAQPRGRVRVRYLGRITLSITWITPLLHLMSVAITFAPSTCTVPSFTSIFTFWPCTVAASVCFTTSAAITLPATTW